MTTIGTYSVSKTLGQGSYGKVVIAEDAKESTQLAIKYCRTDFCPESTLEEFKKEVSIMKMLNHQNLIKLIDCDENSEYIESNFKKTKICYIAMELANEGNLCEIIQKSGRFNELIARHLFRQIIEAIEYMHDNGIAHCDIKLENILLDDKFNIKICDFGFATDEKIRKVKKGTESYLAPEIFVYKEYETFLTDIFAVGVVLFEMLKGSLPFGIASSRDQYYSLFESKNNFFWKAHSTREAKDFFSEEFKNLINGMLKIKPLERFTLEEIKQSDWYNGPLPTDDEIVSEFNRRKEIIECLETQ